jgi:hypothetical protein
MAGEIKQMDLNLQKANEQLKTEYKDAHEKYRRQHIKVKVFSNVGGVDVDHCCFHRRLGEICQGIRLCNYEIPQHENGRNQ